MAAVVFDADFEPTSALTHRLKWSTDVQAASDSTEQRVAIRRNPLHVVSFEARAVVGRESAHLAALLEQGAPDGYKVPWWFDRQLLSANLSIGATVIACNTVGYWFKPGQEAILWASPFLWEIVTVSAVGASSITVSATTLAWTAGKTSLVPVRTGHLIEKQSASRLSRDGVSAAVTFLFPPEALTETPVAVTTYAGYDFLDVFPHRVFDDGEEMDNFAAVVESRAGVFEVDYLTEDNYWTRTHHSSCTTRAQILYAESFAARRYGRYSPFWVPTWVSDFNLAAPAAASAATIIVEKTYKPIMRGHLAIITPTAIHPTTVSNLVDNGNETLTLTLSTALPFPITTDRVLLSYLVLVRQLEDETDFDFEGYGAAEVAIPHTEFASAAAAVVSGVPCGGARFWYMADVMSGILSNNDPLTEWFDYSGENNSAYQYFPTSKPIFKTNIANGLPGIYFKSIRFGADPTLNAVHLNIPDGILSDLTEGEIFIVLKNDFDPAVQDYDTGLWRFGYSAGSDEACYPFTDGIIRDDFGSNAKHITVNPTTSLLVPHVYNVTSKPNSWTNRINGVELFTTNVNTAVFLTTGAKLGSSEQDISITNYCGYMFEVRLFPCELTPSERAAENARLYAKWGITP